MHRDGIYCIASAWSNIHTARCLIVFFFFFHFVQSVDESTKSFMTPMCLVCNISCLCISLFSIFVPFFIVFFFFSSTWLPSRTTSPDVIPGCLACLPRRPYTLWHFKKVASCDHCFYSLFFFSCMCACACVQYVLHVSRASQDLNLCDVIQMYKSNDARE